jgi:hypothetical protein
MFPIRNRRDLPLGAGTTDRDRRFSAILPPNKRPNDAWSSWSTKTNYRSAVPSFRTTRNASVWDV